VRQATRPSETFGHFLDCAQGVAQYLRRRVRDPEVAAELFQDVSIVVLRHSGAPQTGQTFHAWFRGIARNAVAHYFRSQRRQASLLNRAEPEGRSLCAQAPHDPESAFAIRELLDQIFAEVDERSRKLMVDRYLLGRSAQEIAAQIAQSPSAVRMRLLRAREALQKYADSEHALGPEPSD